MTGTTSTGTTTGTTTGTHPVGATMNIRSLIRGHRLATAGVALASTLGGLAEAVFLVIATRLAFAVTNGKDEAGLIAGRTLSIGQALLVALGLVVCRLLLSIWSNTLSVKITVSVTSSIRRELAKAYLETSWARQQIEPVGRLQELMTNYATAGSSLVGAFTGFVSAAFGLFALLSLAIGVDPPGALGIVAAVGILGTALRPLRSRIRSESAVASDANMRFATGLGEIAGLGVETAVFGVEHEVGERIDRLVTDGTRTAERVSLLRGLVPHLYTTLAYSALVGALALASTSDAASLTSLGAVMLVMLRSLSYGQQLQVASSSMSTNRPYVEHLGEQIDDYRRQRLDVGGERVDRVGALQLDHVSFEYVAGLPALRDITATIEANEVVGIIGPSGSGKSTLVQILLGLREPTAGSASAGGREIRSLDRSDWVSRVAFVPQDSRLIAGSIADNIRFFRADVSDDAVVAAAELAGLGREIEQWPDRYDHRVGERGGSLSGGQQQRLCLARALVLQPEVLVLDEPTSSLDVHAEVWVRDSLARLRHRMTIVIIAHRMSTLEICDRIMVIHGGALKAFATPRELAADSSFYREAVAISGLTAEDPADERVASSSASSSAPASAASGPVRNPPAVGAPSIQTASDERR